MVRPIMKDPVFLARKAEPATAADAAVARDLLDTLRAHLDGCVGMAANMIGENKRIIAFCVGPVQTVMLNPRILRKTGEYQAEEGCLSLPGTRPATRYREIHVAFQDERMRPHEAAYSGFTAQIIQHEIDHCEGILI